MGKALGSVALASPCSESDENTSHCANVLLRTIKTSTLVHTCLDPEEHYGPAQLFQEAYPSLVVSDTEPIVALHPRETCERLKLLDEFSLPTHAQIGVIYYCAGQLLCDDMVSNSAADHSREFTNFLNTLSGNSCTRSSASFTQTWNSVPLQFQVSSLIYSLSSSQEPEDDVSMALQRLPVGLVFLDRDTFFWPENIPYSMSVFIVVKPVQSGFRVQTVSKHGITPFGPQLPQSALLSWDELRPFVLTQCLNAYTAVKISLKRNRVAQTTQLQATLSDFAMWQEHYESASPDDRYRKYICNSASAALDTTRFGLDGLFLPAAESPAQPRRGSKLHASTVDTQQLAAASANATPRPSICYPSPVNAQGPLHHLPTSLTLGPGKIDFTEIKQAPVVEQLSSLADVIVGIGAQFNELYKLFTDASQGTKALQQEKRALLQRMAQLETQNAELLRETQRLNQVLYEVQTENNLPVDV
eukprot:m.26427 g.26427  ORF g.26427 m.26427 type:complete len:473 (+) comp8829_c0_seq1:262-1680(+)